MKIGTPTHPKFRRLQKRLKLPTYAVAGLLELIWMLTSQYAPEDGNIGRFSNQEIADYCDFEGDADSLVDALVEARWLDRDADSLRVHDWEDHRPGYIDGRLRMRESRKKQGDLEPCSLTVQNSSEQLANIHKQSCLAKPSLAKPSPTQPSPTQPRQAKPSPVDAPPLAGSLLDDFLSLSEEDVNSDVVPAANALSKCAPKIDREFIWRSSWVGQCIDRGFIADLCDRLRTGSIRKPKLYIERAIADELSKRNLELHSCFAAVPAPPPPPGPITKLIPGSVA